MEVTEVTSDGLERKFKVTISAAELDDKLTAKLEGMKDEIHLKGFRKGKAPVSFLKKMYGKGVMGEIIQDLVTETSEKAFSDRDLQPATQPHPHFHSNMEDVASGKADLEYDVHAEILPTFEPADVNALSLTRPVAEVPEDDIQDSLDNIAKQQRTFTSKDATEPANDGDMVVIDFEGTIDGSPFDGGKGENAEVILGSGGFIPGFEDQLVGVKAGDEPVLNVTFPEDYGVDTLAGKDAAFAVSVHEVRAPDDIAIDDALAEKLGLESLDDLKAKIRERIEAEFKQLSRNHVKRQLLDRLDEAHNFELPPSMLEAEFSQIWSQVENAERDEEDKDKSEDELKAEYRKIAERRVRLGLVLAEIGKRATIEVPNEDIQRQIINTARQFPGQEREVIEFYRSNPQALAQLRAPLFEEKVVDYILEIATVEDKTVSKDELLKDPDGEDI